MYEMDSVDRPGLEPRFGDRDQRLGYDLDSNLDPSGSGGDSGWKLVAVSLSGGAPWGFTLRGGREHGEPLIITKVEEGTKAAAVRLQAGDELVNINEFPLSGYRQEAICLVKGSHKTLTLVVKRRMKMMDIVAQKMPSESDVHVARSFLTKILRSSMRRNEPMSRPHSWHSTKFNESQSDTAKTQSTPSPVWQTRHDASSFSTDFTTGWDNTNLRRVSDQFSSLGSMDSLEHGSHSFPSGRLSPSKSNANSIEHLGGGKRDSAYSSFSTSSGTPDYTLSKSNTASTENMLYKVSQWDSGNRPSNGRHSQSLSDGMRLDDRVGYLQPPSGSSDRESPRAEDQPGYRHSASGRGSTGPVWHIPDMRKTTIAPSTPPPMPPTRSDSFAATKVHEKALIPSHPEVPGVHVPSKPQVKGLEKATENSGSRIYHPNESGIEPSPNYDRSSKSDAHNPYKASDRSNQQAYHLNSNRAYSLSSTDVTVGPTSYTHMPYHQRQYSDESTFHAPSRNSSVPKSQNTNSYYSSMQELPTHSHTQHYNQNRRTVASFSTDQDTDSHNSNRYYNVTSQLHPQGVSQASLVRVDDWKANSATEKAHGGGDRNSISSQGLHKDSIPQIPQHHLTNKDSNGYYRQVDSQHRGYTTVSNPYLLVDDSKVKVSERRKSQQQNNVTNPETQYINYPSIKQAEQGRDDEPLWPTPPSQEHLQLKSDGNICPQKTPMLHSLSQESMTPAENQGEMSQQECADLQSGKVRRNERFATTLRNEIQMRKAQLQKSRSAAALSESADAKEEPSVWKSTENSSSSSSDGSFTISYKDHLKEAQARVLKATSFRRRDLEPVLLEHPGAEFLPSARKDVPPPPSMSEAPPSKSASGGNQVTRICGRKRFSAEKKVHSFSEPEKINAVGVEEEPASLDNAAFVVSRRKFFEAPGKPTYPKPMPKQNLPVSDDPILANPEGKPKSAQNEATRRGSSAFAATKENNPNEGQDGPSSMQRLGTFAEYEATWSTQRKTAEPRTSGRYHSADNILDPGVVERSKPSCFHERSRSSPSEDFYGQNVPAKGRKSADYPLPERKLFENEHTKPSQSLTSSLSAECRRWFFVSDRLSDGGYVSVSKQSPEPEPNVLLVRGDSEGNLSDPLSNPYKSPPNSAGPFRHPPDHSIFSEPSSSSSSSSAKNKVSVSQRPPLPRLEKYKCRESTPSPPPLPPPPPPLPNFQGGAATSHHFARDTNSSAPTHAPVSWKDPECSKDPKREEEEAHTEATPLPPPPFPPATPPSQATGLTQPTMEGQRSPSPQFAPQRLTDKPPVSVSLQDEIPGRMDKVTDESPTVKKVPIKIIHSESSTEKESRQYLHLSGEAPVSFQGTTVPSLSSLGTPEESSSPFCTYTRQRDQGVEAQDPTMGPENEQEPHADVTMREEWQAQQKDPSGDSSSNGVPPVNLSAPSQSEDDEKREVLARDIIDKDKSLADILDQSKMKTTMDLMEGIFPQGEQVMEEAHQRRRAAPKQASSRSTEERREEDSMAAVAPLVTSSAYYSTSAPKAELLIKMKDMQEQTVELDSEEELEEENDTELANKKHELIDSLTRKLQVLREARESLQEDIQDNNALGEEVEAIVQTVCKPNELEKFRMFVGDLDKVVSLLLSLSGRLARVENALNSLEEDAPLEERRTLTEKRKLLIRQHEDAKELKENLDRRERVVYDILASYLSEESMADYEHFVKMKSALIIEQRKLEDKIKLGEEQLKCLVDSLPPDQRMPI